MRNFVYETMYILRPDLTDEQVSQMIEKYQAFIRDEGGTIVETQHRGKRRLAYEIAGQREGIYIQMNYTVEGRAIAQLERAMRLSEEVIRYLTIKQEIQEESEAEAEPVEV
ncbi:30S ribosomal protein S6 [Roseofilum sp. BLCC_M154]|uniref:Small ribosomal subunit protein bS6 n=1 Tax=Roseofilum acuticapitatum BLCC-M154 TaxID=3022444 RepID=A0ABT7AN60_9CYAN|nr:30S ribosomal protein S6 [Roseofilum acuticapitatum BLCC-M154]